MAERRIQREESRWTTMLIILGFAALVFWSLTFALSSLYKPKGNKVKINLEQSRLMGFFIALSMVGLAACSLIFASASCLRGQPKQCHNCWQRQRGKILGRAETCLCPQ